jgi:hypothetical protein
MSKPYELKNPYEVRKKIERAIDGLGMPIDKGIFRAIVILNSLGFETTGSCEGHEDRYSTYPWIDLKFETENSFDENRKLFFDTLFKDIESFYENREVLHKNKITFFVFNDEIFQIRLYICSNPKISKYEREMELRNHYLEITDFCEFLNKKYNLNY